MSKKNFYGKDKMTVYIKGRDGMVEKNNVDAWEVFRLFGMFGPVDSYAIHVTLKGKKKGQRLGTYGSREKADAAMMTVLTNIIEAEKNGGGVVELPQG